MKEVEDVIRQEDARIWKGGGDAVLDDMRSVRG